MKPFALAVGLVSIAGNVWACDPSGTYTGDAALDQSIVVKRVRDGFEVTVTSSGVRMADGTRTVGAVTGQLQVSDLKCAGAYLAPEEECALFFVFRANGVDVHQFGSCLFGAGAWAGGSYKRVPSRSREKGVAGSR